MSELQKLTANPNFLKLWAGETVSLFGTQVTSLALPLTAVMTLQTSPAQLGILNAASYIPFLFFTLPVGIWVDRKRRRPLLIGSNLGRAVLLGLIPLSALLGWLQIEQLYLIAFLAGCLSVCFDVAYISYLPSLVAQSQLTEANSKLQASSSVAQIGGPGLAGLLISLITAPFAILVDALSFLISGLNLLWIKKPELIPARQEGERNLRQELWQGIKWVFGNPQLRAIAGEAGTYNLFSQLIATVLILYATRELGINAGGLGLIYMIGSVGALFGSFLAGFVASQLGFGRAIVGAMLLACLPFFLLPLLGGSALGSGLLLAAIFFAEGIGVVASNVYVVSLRQSITPAYLLGRTTATYRFLTYSTIPLGALLGGVLAELIGLRQALIVGGFGVGLAPLWVLFSPVAKLKVLPSKSQEEHLVDRV